MTEEKSKTNVIGRILNFLNTFRSFMPTWISVIINIASRIFAVMKATGYAAASMAGSVFSKKDKE